MKRDFQRSLLAWKDNPLRTPLVVRGARQVGKTYVIQEFGREKFEDLVTINFEASPEFQKCFEAMDPCSIISQIELISQKKIVPEKTLLFLDEIQQCPRSIQALRYFKENLPNLHVIAAGSLLEFSLNDISFPVGRVQFAKMFPLSFGEYLEGCGDHALREKLDLYTCSHVPPLAVHEHLLKRIKEYFIVGGMPASINTILTTNSLLDVKYAQKALLDAFESDFGKYAKRSQHRHLKKIFQQAPRLLGTHVKYSRIDPELPNPARDIKQALELLKQAGLIHPIQATSAGSVPLLSGLRETIFKLIFLDIGLVQQVMNMDPQNSGLMTGPLAEQFVGQEIVATADPFLNGELFFWSRASGDAEVDYLIVHQGNIYPVEVKAGKSGKLKSLHIFRNEKKAAFGIKISSDSLKFENNVLNVPFYLTSQLHRLIASMNA